MKTKQIDIEIFEKGDKVSTPNGMGVVWENESIPQNEYEIKERDVLVLFDKGACHQIANTKMTMSAWDCIFQGRE